MNITIPEDDDINSTVLWRSTKLVVVSSTNSMLPVSTVHKQASKSLQSGVVQLLSLRAKQLADQGFVRYLSTWNTTVCVYKWRKLTTRKSIMNKTHRSAQPYLFQSLTILG